jgi:hypothetical protein
MLDRKELLVVDLKHQCWAELGGGWVLVGDEDNPLAEAQMLRDELRAHGVNAEVRSRR